MQFVANRYFPMLKVLSIFGTLPEAIKMAPVIRELARHPACMTRKVCAAVTNDLTGSSNERPGTI